jgi:hypothetical protein
MDDVVEKSCCRVVSERLLYGGTMGDRTKSVLLSEGGGLGQINFNIILIKLIWHLV